MTMLAKVLTSEKRSIARSAYVHRECQAILRMMKSLGRQGLVIVVNEMVIVKRFPFC
jgi:hypothetical protein